MDIFQTSIAILRRQRNDARSKLAQEAVSSSERLDELRDVLAQDKASQRAYFGRLLAEQERLHRSVCQRMKYQLNATKYGSSASLLKNLLHGVVVQCTRDHDAELAVIANERAKELQMMIDMEKDVDEANAFSLGEHQSDE